MKVLTTMLLSTSVILTACGGSGGGSGSGSGGSGGGGNYGATSDAMTMVSFYEPEGRPDHTLWLDILNRHEGEMSISHEGGWESIQFLTEGDFDSVEIASAGHEGDTITVRFVMPDNSYGYLTISNPSAPYISAFSGDADFTVSAPAEQMSYSPVGYNAFNATGGMGEGCAQIHSDVAAARSCLRHWQASYMDILGLVDRLLVVEELTSNFPEMSEAMEQALVELKGHVGMYKSRLEAIEVEALDIPGNIVQSFDERSSNTGSSYEIIEFYGAYVSNVALDPYSFSSIDPLQFSKPLATPARPKLNLALQADGCYALSYDSIQKEFWEYCVEGGSVVSADIWSFMDSSVYGYPGVVRLFKHLECDANCPLAIENLPLEPLIDEPFDDLDVWSTGKSYSIVTEEPGDGQQNEYWTTYHDDRTKTEYHKQAWLQTNGSTPMYTVREYARIDGGSGTYSEAFTFQRCQGDSFYQEKSSYEGSAEYQTGPCPFTFLNEAPVTKDHIHKYDNDPHVSP